MSVIAIIGAGPGMGLAIANIFGAQGFKVALLSRSPTNLEPLVSELTREGIEVDAFRADVLDRESIAGGLAAVKQRFGTVDVLEYSPVDRTLPLAPATALTYESVQTHIDFTVHGAVVAVNQVLPDMLNRGSGTILFTTGACSVYPRLRHERFANYGAAAWLRSWAHALHAALAPKGVQVGHVVINTFIGRQPSAIPEAIAPLYWELHTRRDEIERVYFAEP